MHHFLVNHGWRLALAASGFTLVAGGSMHPSADAADPLRQELATMTDHPDWWRSHILIVASTVLLAVGLWLAVRRGGWAERVGRPLLIAAIAVSVYVVETVFHLLAAVDTDALRDGGAAPVAFTHVGLALVLYPVTGVALAALGVRTFGAVDLPRKPIAVLLVVAGVMHAASVPLSVLLPDTELSPVFAGSAVLLAVWSLLTAAGGLGSCDTYAVATRRVWELDGHRDRRPTRRLDVEHVRSASCR